MANVRRLARALGLVLLLPALLAPRGWAWQVCLCRALDAQSAQALQSAPSAAAADCCAARADAELVGEDASEQRAGCCDVASGHAGGDRCADCGSCRRYDAGNRALHASPGLPELPAAMPSAGRVAVTTDSAPRASWSRMLTARGLAPPGAPPPLLPLRI